jgi:hypothetical protein
MVPLIYGRPGNVKNSYEQKTELRGHKKGRKEKNLKEQRSSVYIVGRAFSPDGGRITPPQN